jgi:hypothetical protein
MTANEANIIIPPKIGPNTLQIRGCSLIMLAYYRIINTNLWEKVTSYFMDGGWLLPLLSYFL